MEKLTIEQTRTLAAASRYVAYRDGRTEASAADWLRATPEKLLDISTELIALSGCLGDDEISTRGGSLTPAAGNSAAMAMTDIALHREDQTRDDDDAAAAAAALGAAASDG